MAKKKRGRKPKPAADLRTHAMTLRMTRAEAARLAEFARNDCRSQADWLLITAGIRRVGSGKDE